MQNLIMKVHNKSKFAYDAEFRALNQIEELKKDLKGMLTYIELIKTELNGAGFDTYFAIKFRGSNEGDLKDKIDNEGIKYINYELQNNVI